MVIFTSRLLTAFLATALMSSAFYFDPACLPRDSLTKKFHIAEKRAFGAQPNAHEFPKELWA